MALCNFRQPIPANTLYVDTVHWTFHCDISKLEFIRSSFFKERYFHDILFCLQAGKSSDTSISIELLRVLMKSGERPDDGFVLEAYIKLIGSRTAPECRIMGSDSNYVSVDYKIANLIAAENESNCWTVRCVLKMKEMTSLGNNLSRKHEGLLKVIPSEFRYGKNFVKKTADMAFLLNRKSLGNLFTGRQGDEFAINKCIFIERTLFFVSEIAEKVRAKKNNIPYEQKSDMASYLCFIYCERFGNISLREAADLYVTAHYYGLEYLQNECREFMLNHLDKESILDVLIVADLVNDYNLLDKALGLFVKEGQQIMRTTQWENLLAGRRWRYAHSIIDSILRKVLIEGIPQAMPWHVLDEIQNSSTDKKSTTLGTSTDRKSTMPDTSTDRKSGTPGTSSHRKSTTGTSTGRKSATGTSTGRKPTTGTSTGRKSTTGTSTARKATTDTSTARKATTDTSTARRSTTGTSTGRKSAVPGTSTVRKSTTDTLTVKKSATSTPNARKCMILGTSTGRKSKMQGTSTGRKTAMPGTSSDSKSAMPGASSYSKSVMPGTSTDRNYTPPRTSTDRKYTPPRTSTYRKYTPPRTSTYRKYTTPRTSTVRKFTTSCTSTVKKSTTPRASAAGEYTTPDPSAAGSFTTSGRSAAGNSTTLGPMIARKSTAPGSLVAGKSTAPGPSAAGKSTIPGSSAAGKSMTPRTSAARKSTAPRTSAVRKSTAPYTSTGKKFETPCKSNGKKFETGTLSGKKSATICTSPPKSHRASVKSWNKWNKTQSTSTGCKYESSGILSKKTSDKISNKSCQNKSDAPVAQTRRSSGANGTSSHQTKASSTGVLSDVSIAIKSEANGTLSRQKSDKTSDKSCQKKSDKTQSTLTRRKSEANGT